MIKSLIQHHIFEHGFITLDNYMHICMQHQTDGYYRTGNPIGKDGDFITAPEISQIFGELIGIFISFHLQKLFPNGYQICELGAGRGTLANDYLRILTMNPPTNVFFLESNDTLKQQQSNKIPVAKHIDNLNQLPHIPTLFLANEFFDALPIKAYKLFGSEQSEIIITLDDVQNLKFDYAKPTKNNSNRHRGYYETSPETLGFCEQIADYIKNYQGAFLLCDYGYTEPLEKLTFRGFMNHTVTNGLQSPCQEDLTADVNFSTIMNYFYHKNLNVSSLLTQAEFLKALHIDTRLHRLLRNITDNDMKQQMINGVQKMIAPTEMGKRFKFLFVNNHFDEFYPFTTHYNPKT